MKDKLISYLKSKELKTFLTLNKKSIAIGGGVFLFLVLGFVFEIFYTEEKAMVSSVREVAFDKDARVFDSSNKDLYKGKDDYYKKQVYELIESNRKMHEEITKIKKELSEEKVTSNENKETKEKEPEKEVQEVSTTQSSNQKVEKVELSPPADDMSKYLIDGSPANSQTATLGKEQTKVSKSVKSRRVKGHKLVVFKDVKNKREIKKKEVVLPTGSYVKVKLLTGVRSIESKAYPVLAQVDYAFVGPNKKKIDLTGCFAILKTQGNLSTESVEAQGTKISCVSKSGTMFEREIDGYLADDKDNIFGVRGKIVSKQDRVAAMAFLSSIVEGVGKSIQQAQVQQSQNALGQSSSLITGSQGKYIAAGGVSNAASLVTQWYLKQAQSLLPYIEIGSGLDTWLVMTKSVSLPNNYFKELRRSKENEKEYSYYTNVLF